MPQISLPSNITFKYCVKEGEALKDVRGYLKNEEFIFKMDDGRSATKPGYKRCQRT
jgi:hypothetical protein